jgi:uncharacterized damage-inducible protein DinB
MTEKRALLRHFLAALAYRTQKALRGAPDGFGTFQPGHQARTPADLVRHMTSVLGYARTFFVGGRYWPEPLPDLASEVARFHDMLADLARHLDAGTEPRGTTEERLLQGPFADAMTHAGQLALLRRLAGSPVPPENFVEAAIDPANVGPAQADPISPDAVWPEAAGARPDDRVTLTAVLLAQAEAVYSITARLFARVADDELSWSPPGRGWMTMGQLMMHCASFGCGRAVRGFVTADWGLTAGSSSAEHVPPADALPAVTSVAEALDLLAADRDLAMRCIRDAGEANLLRPAAAPPWGGPELSLFQQLLQMIAHLAQHKGQLFYYLKLMGKDVNTADLWGG